MQLRVDIVELEHGIFIHIGDDKYGERERLSWSGEETWTSASKLEFAEELHNAHRMNCLIWTCLTKQCVMLVVFVEVVRDNHQREVLCAS